MTDPFKTNNKLGLPFSQSVSQTLLPIVCGGNGRIHGFFTIETTPFDGTETTFELVEGSIPVKSVTLPDRADDGTGFGVKQYVAAYWEPSEEAKAPWRGYSAFVDSNDTGYVMRHYMPTQGYKAILNRGALVTALEVSMDTSVPLPQAPAAPTATNAAISWTSSMKVNSAQLQCGFFDFNWVTLFKAKSQANAIRLEVVSNPASGEFKSTLVPQPIVTPNGAVEFDTVRIIKLRDPVPGAYTFTYKVYDDLNQSTTCTLTLNIVN